MAPIRLNAPGVFSVSEFSAVWAYNPDMLSCLDALRWGKSDLYKLLPDGERRIQARCQVWRLEPRG